MKRFAVTGLILIVAPMSAMAACTGSTRVSYTALLNLLPGKTVCSKNGGNDWHWQELHQGTAGSTSGNLVDYKKGPNDKVDPSKTVGTWQITRQGASANGGVSYRYTAYGSAGPYSHTVHANSNGTHSFCGGGQEVIASIENGPNCTGTPAPAPAPAPASGPVGAQAKKNG